MGLILLLGLGPIPPPPVRHQSVTLPNLVQVPGSPFGHQLL